jgi:hypothetical protein
MAKLTHPSRFSEFQQSAHRAAYNISKELDRLNDSYSAHTSFQKKKSLKYMNHLVSLDDASYDKKGNPITKPTRKYKKAVNKVAGAQTEYAAATAKGVGKNPSLLHRVNSWLNEPVFGDRNKNIIKH